ncbi:hypothetical protein HPB51_024709 [Rhipicephalus microplus]|uniref:Uncharacterized protein n=1 Tax=Rhipicephalus microplus TaxID=6941 RepID=A0A9J6EV44_RHIMP|nr:hypothetical protein HPB51_024709 [Rhipicephalus microplus]
MRKKNAAQRRPPLEESDLTTSGASALRRSSRELRNLRYQTAGDLPCGVRSSGASGTVLASPSFATVAYYAAGGRGVDAAPHFRGGRLSGSMLVDVSQQPTLLASLNRSANPCHNFYRFVCDGWLARQGDRFSLLEESTVNHGVNLTAALQLGLECRVRAGVAADAKEGRRKTPLGLVSQHSAQLVASRAEASRTRVSDPNTAVTRSLVDSIFEADDEVLRVTNVYNGGRESRTIDKLCEVAPEFQASSQRVRDGSVHQVMPLAAAKPYADAASWNRGLIEELFEASKRSYRKRIDRSTLMDEATRQFARDKIRSVNGVVPVPGLIWNASALERIYESVSRGRELSSLPYLLEARRCKQRLLLSVAGSGQSSTETITWTSPTAYLVRYLDVYNSAVLMGSVLYPPVLQTSGDHRDVFNYAGLVFLFSKLLYGAVGQRGSLRDSVGTLRPWWSNATHEGFSRAARCFEDLYQFDARFIDDDIGAAVAVTVAFAAYERRLRDLYALHSAGLWRLRSPVDAQMASLVQQRWTARFRGRPGVLHEPLLALLLAQSFELVLGRLVVGGAKVQPAP